MGLYILNIYPWSISAYYIDVCQPVEPMLHTTFGRIVGILKATSVVAYFTMIASLMVTIGGCDSLKNEDGEGDSNIDGIWYELGQNAENAEEYAIIDIPSIIVYNSDGHEDCWDIFYYTASETGNNRYVVISEDVEYDVYLNGSRLIIQDGEDVTELSRSALGREEVESLRGICE